VELSGVQQTVLDLLVLLMGAAGGMKKDYNMIIETIEELSQVHSGNVEVLEYIIKIKNSVNELKRRDELLDALITFTNDLRDSLNELNNEINVNINSINSSLAEINKRQSNTDETIININDTIENTKNNFDKIVNERHQDLLNTLTELQISQSKEYKKLEVKFKSNRKYLIILTSINAPLIILIFYLLSRI
jgi:ABC-type transporter Mla subunit MlaD